jgi:hypothetical protein
MSTRDRLSAEAPAPAEGAAADRVTKWVVALFFVTLLIPGSFDMGVRMTPYRLFLIAMAAPALLRCYNDPTLRLTAVDAFVFLACAWRALALIANHGTGEIVFAGASFMELFFGYVLGRAYVRGAADYRWFFRCFIVFLLAALPFALLESVLRTRVIRNVAAVLLTQPPIIESSPQIRFGLMRVQLSFDHALLFGTFCALGFANMYYLHRGHLVRRTLLAGFVGFMTLLAISSSSMLALILQGCLIVYEKVFRMVTVKWVVLGIGMAFFLGSFRLLFGMSPIEYVAYNLTLNVSGAMARLDQIHYGLLEIQRHPIFGIGLNTFTRPFWRADVFDNFWLAMAVRYGAPTALFFAAAFALHALRAAMAPLLSEEERQLRLAYLIPLVALVFTLGTHSIWGSGMVYVMLYVGIGAWIYDRPRPAPRRRSAPAEAAAPPRPLAAARRAGPGRRGAAAAGRIAVRSGD